MCVCMRAPRVIFAIRIQEDKRSPVAPGINDSGRLPRVSRYHVTNDATKKKNGNVGSKLVAFRIYPLWFVRHDAEASFAFIRLFI